MEPASKKEETNEYLEYKDKPSGLFKVARDKINKSQYEDGLSILEKAIIFALDKYGSNRDIHMAIFYTRYAEALIRKLLENDELLAIPNNPNMDEISNTVSNKVKKEGKNGEDQGEEDQGEEDEEISGEVSDEQIILENLLMANGIYLKYLTPFDLENDITKLDKSVVEFYNELAFNYLMFGEYEKAKSDFPKASEYYLKAVELRRKYDTLYSRDLAELYFNLAFVYDNEPKKCLLSYFKAKTIMEYHLSVELEKCKFPLNLIINSDDLNLTELTEKDERIFINKNIVLSDEIKELSQKEDEIENLVFILNSLYTKLEDTSLECSQFEEFKKEKAKLIEEQPQTGTFTENYDKSKVVDITNTVIRKKRARSPDVQEKKEEEEEIKKVANPPEHK